MTDSKSFDLRKRNRQGGFRHGRDVENVIVIWLGWASQAGSDNRTLRMHPEFTNACDLSRFFTCSSQAFNAPEVADWGVTEEATAVEATGANQGYL